MPVAIDPHVKEQVKATFIAGVQRVEIARRYNLKVATVDTWAKRGNWLNLRASVQEPVDRAITLTVKDGLRAESDRLRQKLSKQFHRTTDTLSEVAQRKNVRDVSAHATALSTLASAAAKVYGWQDGSGAAVQVNLISGLREQAQDAEPIDIDQASTEPEQGI